MVFMPLLILFAHLSRSINDLCQKSLAFVYNLVAECVFDSRIVTFDKVAFAVLDGEG